MLRNYLKIAYRNLLKNKVFSLINIFGLAIGIVASFMVLIFVGYEFSFDRFHTKADQLFRVNLSTQVGETAAIVQPSLGPAAQEAIPEVKSFTRLYTLNNQVLRREDQALRIGRIFCVDPSFLENFSVTWLKGNPQQALATPQSVVLSASTAKKLFGNEEPIGQTVYGTLAKNFIVTGIFEDFPQNSHFHPEVLLSYQMLYGDGSPAWFKAEGWDYVGFHTYLLLDEKAEPERVANKITELAKVYLPGNLKNFSYQLLLVKDIHLFAHTAQELSINGNARQVYILLFVGILILIIANINYMNLTALRATERAKEVGVRKIMGAGKDKLFIQFMGENLLMSALIFVLSVTLLQLFLPVFTQLSGVPSGFIYENGSTFLLILLALFLLNTLLSGIYPATLMTAFSPLGLSKINASREIKGVGLRKALVGFQFCVSLALIVFTFTVQQQVAYMRNQPLGFDLDQTLVVRMPVRDSILKERAQYFNNQLMNESFVRSLSFSTEVPAQKTKWSQGFVSKHSQMKEKNVQIGIIWADDKFINQYKISLLAGRNFSENLDKSEKAVLLNKEATELLEFTHLEAAIGEQITWTGNQEDFEIVGIMEDYHHMGLHEAIGPLVYIYRKAPMRYASVKIATHDYQTSLARITTLWKEVYPETPVEYFFLDESFQAQYLKDQKLEKFMFLFSGLAILVACLGLFGLSSITVKQRTKEIGIRKVLGASVENIVVLLSKDYIKLMFLACLLVLPVAHFLVREWLENYAYHINIGWWLFVSPIAIVMLIALLTISFQTISTALTNPVKSLRYE